MSVAFLIGAFGLRRYCKHYEAEVLPLAVEDLQAEGEAETPNPNVYL